MKNSTSRPALPKLLRSGLAQCLRIGGSRQHEHPRALRNDVTQRRGRRAKQPALDQHFIRSRRSLYRYASQAD